MGKRFNPPYEATIRTFQGCNSPFVATNRPDQGYNSPFVATIRSAQGCNPPFVATIRQTEGCKPFVVMLSTPCINKNNLFTALTTQSKISRLQFKNIVLLIDLFKGGRYEKDKSINRFYKTTHPAKNCFFIEM